MVQPVFRGGLKPREKTIPMGHTKYPDWLTNADEEKDPWVARDAFSDDVRKMSAYFGDFTYFFGRFGSGPADLQFEKPKGSLPMQGYLDVGLQHDFQEWRELLRVAAKIPMEKWPSLANKFPRRKVKILQKPIPLRLEWRKGRPVGVMYLHTAVEAIIASIQIDKLNEVELGQCARCRRVYPIESRHERKYCGPECGHYMAVKNSRERAAKNMKSRG
jgi:hypothetical protein